MLYHTTHMSKSNATCLPSRISNVNFSTIFPANLLDICPKTSTMAMPALRQPKFVPRPLEKQQQPPKTATLDTEEPSFLILTLKNEKKLVVTSDAYNGIVKAAEGFECVFCDRFLEPDHKLKEIHKTSREHRKVMDGIPFKEDFAENLVRQLSKDQAYYCTLCHAVVQVPFLARHLVSETHNIELEKAGQRALIYKPYV